MKITDHIHALKIPFQITDPSGHSLSRFVYVYMIYGQEISLSIAEWHPRRGSSWTIFEIQAESRRRFRS